MQECENSHHSGEISLRLAACGRGAVERSPGTERLNHAAEQLEHTGNKRPRQTSFCLNIQYDIRWVRTLSKCLPRLARVQAGKEGGNSTAEPSLSAPGVFSGRKLVKEPEMDIATGNLDKERASVWLNSHPVTLSPHIGEQSQKLILS